MIWLKLSGVESDCSTNCATNTALPVGNCYYDYPSGGSQITIMISQVREHSPYGEVSL